MRNLELRISLIFLLVALNCGGTAPIQKDSASSPSNFSETGLYGYVRGNSVNVRSEGKLASDKIEMLKKAKW